MIQEWPLFKGDNDIEQLSLVVKALGQPTHNEFVKLPDFNKIQFVSAEEIFEELDENEDIPKWLQMLRRKCPSKCSALVLDLIKQLCCYTDRLNSDQLLKHPYVMNEKQRFDDGLMERFLIKTKQIKHLSGPPKNEI